MIQGGAGDGIQLGRPFVAAFLLLASSVAGIAWHVRSSAGRGVDLQAAINALGRAGGEVVIPAGTYDLSAGLVVNGPNIALRAAAGWSQVGGGVTFRAVAPMATLLALKNAQGFHASDIKFECNGRAAEGVAFAGDIGAGYPSYSAMERFHIHGCQTGLVVGRQIGAVEHPVVGLSFENVQINRNGHPAKRRQHG